MHIRTILAIARKDALDILLNKMTLTMLITPILIALLFVMLGKLIGSHTTNVLVYNPGKSGVEQVVDSAFTNIKTTYANSPDDVVAAFGPDGSHKSVAYAVGVVVPADFDTSLRSGGHPQLSLYIDGDQTNTIDRQLLVRALTDYSRSVASPQAPANISVATINPPSPASNPLQDIGILYAATALFSSFLVGTALVPGLLAEEKEKRTLRMLMVSPASFSDVVAGKLLVGLTYQLILAAVVLTITGGFVGQIPLVLLFALLGSLFSISVGLLLGSIFSTTSATGAASGMLSLIYIIPIFFVGTFAQLFGNNSVASIVKLLPTYYVADGTVNGLLNKGTPGSALLDAGVAIGSIVVLFLIATWALRRQAAVVSTI